MKATMAIVLIIAVFLGAGLYGFMEKKTSGLRAEIQNLKQRLQKMEEESKAAPLQPDADTQKIIKSVNSLSAKVVSLENALTKNMASNDEALKRQKAATEEALKKQTEAIDKLNKETQAKLQKIMFDAKMANIRGHIAKARTDLLSKNIATAKTELELIDEVFEASKTSVSDENIKTIGDLQTTLKKARTEIDADLPAAISRVDLLWHEMSTLLRKG
ncbi:MAG: hypothetical protein AABY42_00195 [Nitrospirota bacterium]